MGGTDGRLGEATLLKVPTTADLAPPAGAHHGLLLLQALRPLPTPALQSPQTPIASSIGPLFQPSEVPASGNTPSSPFVSLQRVGGSCFMQFLISGFPRHPLYTLSAFQYLGKQFLLTNTPGSKYLVQTVFPTGPRQIQQSLTS